MGNIVVRLSSLTLKNIKNPLDSKVNFRFIVDLE